METIYDIIIIGGGPAGITAGIYGVRSGLKVLILEKQNVGGSVINTYEIKNFPTYNNITGADFCVKLYEQASYNNLEIINEEVVEVDFNDKIKTIKTKNILFKTKTVIICSGTTPRKLGVENEDNLIGRGISYCALCDGNFFKDKIVGVVGGGDSSMEDAIYLSSLCKKVYVFVRNSKLKAQVVLQNTLMETGKKNNNIELLYNTKVNKLFGENKLEEIEIETNFETKKLKIDGLFLAIGSNPDTILYKNKLDLNDYGYIKTDANLQTSKKGVFAGGDVIEKQIRQIITACSDGAVCATNANNFIKENF